MDIKILDSWLRDHLETNAKPHEIARYVSLCGPTFDRTNKVKGENDYIYDVEVTTNRVDAMSVRGLAREASVILPEFGFKAKLKPLPKAGNNKPSKKVPLTIQSKEKLTKRVMGVVLEVDSIGKSPLKIKKRLEASGIRSLNAAVDITNYIMTDLGHPTHVFDYDLVKPKMILRESQKGEKIISLEGKEYELPGGDIVIDNGNGEIIDLPGIIGTKNSVVNKNTKRILFFLETNDPVRIRKTSMTLGIRTIAATLNEKGVDPELAQTAMEQGINLFKQILNAKQISEIYDIYNVKYKTHNLLVSHKFIEERIGVTLKSSQIVRILKKLGYVVSFNKEEKEYDITPPSFRANDTQIPEDIVEEVARIYGYHNLPSEIMSGTLPEPRHDTTFAFEQDVKNTLLNLGGHEVYTYSMVSENMVGKDALKLKNPLGADSSHMRDKLMPSLVEAAIVNNRENNPFFLFEMANIYEPQKNKLPQEKLTLGILFANHNYRKAKGIIETLFLKLNTKITIELSKSPFFKKDHALSYTFNKETIGSFGELKNYNYLYAELDINLLFTSSSETKPYIPIPRFPAQIEDITLILKPKTKIGNVMSLVNKQEKIDKVELIDIYEDAYTFRIWYLDKEKTLTDDEVTKIRSRIVTSVKEKFDAQLKS